MRTPRLLDSYALLAYLNGEAGAEKVRAALKEGRDRGQLLLMSEINIGEVYYILSRKRGMDKADYFIESVLPGLPISVLAVDSPLVMEAARLKAKYPLSYADCFAVATAARAKAAVMTGDLEFKAASDLITVEWLG